MLSPTAEVHPLGPAQHPGELLDRLSRHDARHLHVRVHRAPRERQAVAVGGHQPQLLLPRDEIEAVQEGPALVLRHRVARPPDHRTEEPRLHAEAPGPRVQIERRVLLGREPDQLESRGPALELDPAVVEKRERDGLRGQLAHELHQLPRGQRDGARPVDRPRHRHSRADLEIRGREAEPALPGLDQNVGQDRQRLARLDDVLQELQCTQQWLASDLEVHVS